MCVCVCVCVCACACACACAAVVLIVTAFLFFTVEQSRIAGNIAKSKKALEQNAAVKAANEKLEEAKTDLQAEEDECVFLLALRKKGGRL